MAAKKQTYELSMSNSLLSMRDTISSRRFIACS